MRIDQSLPGSELVEKGLADLAANQVTEASLLLQISGPRLRRLGIEIPDAQPSRPYEHQLYELLEDRVGHDAHSQYNSLIRRIVSFASALEREQR